MSPSFGCSRWSAASATRWAIRCAGCCCRRCRGSAVWGFRLDGVVHEHQTVQGVLEDVHQIIQRLKPLTLVLDEAVDEAVLRIKKQGPGPVYARDIQERARHGHQSRISSSSPCRTIAKSAANCTSTRAAATSRPRCTPDRSYPVDLVRIDSIYNPVRRANFTVAETRVGQRTDYDRLAVSVETNGHHVSRGCGGLCRRAGAGAFPLLRRVRQGAGRPTAAWQPPPAGPRRPTAGPAGPPDRRPGAVGPVRSIRSRTPTSGPSGIWSNSATTISSRSRTSATRHCRRSPSCCRREGLNFGDAV